MRIRAYLPYLIAIGLALPGLVLRLLGVHLSPPMTVMVSGVGILGASFLLLWACDAAQADISQALALAVVALIAVLPEYAVDMYFTWQAGQNPDSDYAHYAIANMTGANRLLVGVAWGLIALVYWFKRRQAVQLEPQRRTELLFLGMATAYAFVIPIKGTLAWYDGLVFLGLYVWYIILSAKRPCVQVEEAGPADLLLRLPKARRRIAVSGLFLFAAGVILANAEPFSEGLVASGKAWGINEFLLVQWLAPIASEAPEFTVALMFAWRGHAGLALGSLLSSKLNQWTLLVGMIPAVFGLSHQTLSHPLPMDAYQMREILLTAAQSFLAVVMLASLRLSLGGALLLFSLFTGQLVLPEVVRAHPGAVFGIPAHRIHDLFTLLYFVAAAAIMLPHPSRVWQLRHGTRILDPSQRSSLQAVDAQSTPPGAGDDKCSECHWFRQGQRAGADKQPAGDREQASG